MIVRVIVGGKIYNLASSQAVVCTDDGKPVAISYESAGAIIHSDAADADFSKVISDLGIGLSAPVVDKVR